MFKYNLFSKLERRLPDIFYYFIMRRSTILFPTAIAIALVGTISCTTQVKLESSTVTQTQSKSRGNSSVSNAENIDSTLDYRKITLVENLEHPWSLAWLPDGEILITERPGRLRIIRDGNLDQISIAGVPQVFAMGQGGLLDVSVHPRFAENRLIYLTYSLILINKR